MSQVKKAAILVRISDDKAEDAAGVGRQERDCRELAARQGWTVGQVYIENDTSAYKRRTIRLPDGSTALRVVRPAFRQMLDDLASGACDALAGYDLDRVARDPRDLEDLIDIVESRSIPTRAVTGSLDLSSDAGVTMARVMVAVANKSSRDTARRVTRKQQELAEQGRHKGGGIRSYGYERDGRTIVEAEAAVLRQVAADVLAGTSLDAIAKRLSAQSVPTVRGNTFEDGRPRPWNRRSVHAAVTKARVAGLSEYRGEVVAVAEWPAVLDRDLWEQVRLALAGRAEGHTNLLQRWLTGVLRCGKCSTGLTGTPQGQGRGHRYYCNPQKGGCAGIGLDATGAEATVEAWIVAYLSKPANLAGLRAETAAGNLDQLRIDIRADEEQLRELAGLWAARSVTTKEYMAARQGIERRLTGAQQLVKSALPGGVRVLLSADDIGRVWAALRPSDKRQAAQKVFPSGIVVAGSTGSRFDGFDPERMSPIDWTGTGTRNA